jgi:hypothetical protein
VSACAMAFASRGKSHVRREPYDEQYPFQPAQP